MSNTEVLNDTDANLGLIGLVYDNITKVADSYYICENGNKKYLYDANNGNIVELDKVFIIDNSSYNFVGIINKYGKHTYIIDKDTDKIEYVVHNKVYDPFYVISINLYKINDTQILIKCETSNFIYSGGSDQSAIDIVDITSGNIIRKHRKIDFITYENNCIKFADFNPRNFTDNKDKAYELFEYKLMN